MGENNDNKQKHNQTESKAKSIDKAANQQSTINDQQSELDSLNFQLEASRFDLPLLKISETILLVPLVGAMDSVKSLKVMEDILNAIRDQSLRVVIIDLAGINVVDSSVAMHLIKVAKATKLMGCKSIISGISPLIANNIVNLGVDVGDLTTTNTLSDAITSAYESIGMRLVVKQ